MAAAGSFDGPGSRLLEAVHSAVEVVGAEVVEVSFGAGDVGFELVGDGCADRLPVLFGLLKHDLCCLDGSGPVPSFATTEAGCFGAALRVSVGGAGLVELSGGVAFGGVAPPAGSSVQVGKVVVQLLEFELDVLAGGRRGDRGGWGEAVESLPHRDDVALQCLLGVGLEAGFDGGGVGDPALVAGDSPVALQVINCLVEVVGGEVDGGVVPGAAHGHVAEFSAAASGEDVGLVVGGALGLGAR